MNGSIQRSSDSPDLSKDAGVIAAGAIIWRERSSGLEVLLIHRPRYDDWSWPKGKLDDGETIPECAIREVQEEIGMTVKLGIPLPASEYPVKSDTKVVYYWAARATGSVAPDGREVDGYQWVTPEIAHKLLSNSSDLEPLDALVNAHRKGDLNTVPFILLRHAKAKPRSSWTRDEGLRPLAATGKRQSLSVKRILTAWQPEKIYTSPWTRCVQTIMPYAQAIRKDFKEVGSLTEKAAKRNPKAAAKSIKKLIERGESLVVCTHRPVLPMALGVFKHHLINKLDKGLPSEDPYLRPGALLIAHQVVGRPGRLISLEHYEPYDD